MHVPSSAMPIIKPTGRFRGFEIADDRVFMEPAEVLAVFRALKASPFWYGYFRLQYHFGCRVSEVSLVLREDVSYKEKAICLRRLKRRNVEEPPLSVYPAPDALLSILKAVPLVPGSPWLFPSPQQGREPGKQRLAQLRTTMHKGVQWQAVSRFTARKVFREAAEQAKIPEGLAHTHVLRHTRATLMLADGVPEQDVCFLLGHSSVDVTRQYLHFAHKLKMRAGRLAEQLGNGDLSTLDQEG